MPKSCCPQSLLPAAGFVCPFTGLCPALPASSRERGEQQRDAAQSAGTPDGCASSTEPSPCPRLAGGDPPVIADFTKTPNFCSAGLKKHHCAGLQMQGKGMGQAPVKAFQQLEENLERIIRHIYCRYVTGRRTAFFRLCYRSLDPLRLAGSWGFYAAAWMAREEKRNTGKYTALCRHSHSYTICQHRSLAFKHHSKPVPEIPVDERGQNQPPSAVSLSDSQATRKKWETKNTTAFCN